MIKNVLFFLLKMSVQFFSCEKLSQFYFIFFSLSFFQNQNIFKKKNFFFCAHWGGGGGGGGGGGVGQGKEG